MGTSDIISQIREKKSFLCVGLDPDLDKIPQHLFKYKNPVLEFNKLIIDHTKDLCIAYKPNMAFFEKLGNTGFETLKKTIEYIPKNHLVIADAKRSDISNSAKMYADTFYDFFGVDAVTISPYMGKDAVIPFLVKDKYVILLAATSNDNASDVQNIQTQSGLPLYAEIVKMSKKWSNNQIMYVIGANKTDEMKLIRSICPNSFFLVPGIGFQGGDLKSVCKYGLTKSCGLIINMSRSILYADSGNEFYKHSRFVCKNIQNEMKTELEKIGF
tara:strand:+ start:517 stop:1329 length:813 start_codon:yes stop_codon:yes gene_type:complete